MAKVMFASGSRAWANNLNDLRERWNIRHEPLVDFSDFPKVEKKLLSRHGVEKIKVMPAVLFSEDLRKIPKTKLLELKKEVYELQNKYQASLSECFKNNVLNVSQDIYNNLIESKKSTTLHVLAVDAELGRRKEVNKNSFMQVFMDVCRKKIDADLFRQISEEAYKVIADKHDDDTRQRT